MTFSFWVMVSFALRLSFKVLLAIYVCKICLQVLLANFTSKFYLQILLANFTCKFYLYFKIFENLQFFFVEKMEFLHIFKILLKKKI